MNLRKICLTGAAALAMSTAALALSTAPSAAYVACNGGDCWHTDRREHAPGVSFTYHPDDWYFHQHWDDNHHWRDYHEGHGYYRNGIWVTL
jgi:hypothetical protein